MLHYRKVQLFSNNGISVWAMTKILKLIDKFFQKTILARSHHEYSFLTHVLNFKESANNYCDDLRPVISKPDRVPTQLTKISNLRTHFLAVLEKRGNEYYTIQLDDRPHKVYLNSFFLNVIYARTICKKVSCSTSQKQGLVLTSP